MLDEICCHAIYALSDERECERVGGGGARIVRTVCEPAQACVIKSGIGNQE
jgi:hypothetical protein